MDKQLWNGNIGLIPRNIKMVKKTSICILRNKLVLTYSFRHLVFWKISCKFLYTQLLRDYYGQRYRNYIPYLLNIKVELYFCNLDCMSIFRVDCSLVGD